MADMVLSDEAAAPTYTDRHRNDIEGLRAVAVLLVVVYHAFPATIPGGFIGVDVFFVISGFVITRQLLRGLRQSGHVSFLAFYARRARRILPAAALTTVATLVAASLVLSPLDTERVIGDAWAATGFVMNYHLAIQGNDYLTASLPPSPLQHYWSLSVEEQFYILWPALLAATALAARSIGRGLARKRSTPVGISVETLLAVLLLGLGAASLTASIVETRSDPVLAYYALWTRAFELAVGGLVAVLASRVANLGRRVRFVSGWVGVAMIALAAGVFRDRVAFPSDAALLPAIGAGGVIVAGANTLSLRNGAERLLSLAPMQWIGARSYSWYLWHFPFLVLAPAVVGHGLSKPEALAVIIMSLLAASLSFSFVEGPIRRLPSLAARPRLGITVGLSAIGAAALAVVAIAGTLPSLAGAGPARSANSRFPSRSTQGLTDAKVSADIRAGAQITVVPVNLSPVLDTAKKSLPITYTDGCHLSIFETVNPPCIFGDTRSQTTVVLFGDSHAAQWFPALNVISKRDGWRLVSLTKSGCPPVDVTLTRPPGVLPYPQCSTWRVLAETRIDRLHPFLVVTSWYDAFAARASRDPSAPKGYGSAWDNGVASTFAALRRSHAVIVYIEDTPEFAISDPSCVADHLGDATQCVGRLADDLVPRRVADDQARIALHFGIHIVNPTSWLCFSGVCPGIVGNLLVRRDGGHMTPAYSTFLAPVLADTILRLLPLNSRS